MFQSERKTFLDFNNKKVIKSESIGGASYDEESSKAMQKNIIKTINKKKIIILYCFGSWLLLPL